MIAVVSSHKMGSTCGLILLKGDLDPHPEPIIVFFSYDFLAISACTTKNIHRIAVIFLHKVGYTCGTVLLNFDLV